MEKPDDASCLTAFVGNLRSDKEVEDLQKELQIHLEKIGVQIVLSDIKVLNKSSKKPSYGFINFKNKETFDICAQKLKGLSARDAVELVFPGMMLEVDVSRKRPAEVSKLEAKGKKKRTRKRTRKNKKTNCTSSIKKTKSNMPFTSVSMTTDSITLATLNASMATSPLLKKVNASSNKHGLPSEYFYVGQKLGTEDRLTEYKQGGGNYLNLRFRDHVETYVCAFLNSEGGRLLIGVKDDCTVCGLQLTSHREDQLRLDFDRIMKGFVPSVFPSSYHVDFIPVYYPQMEQDHLDYQTEVTEGSLNALTIGERNSSDTQSTHEQDMSCTHLNMNSLQINCIDTQTIDNHNDKEYIPQSKQKQGITYVQQKTDGCLDNQTMYKHKLVEDSSNICAVRTSTPQAGTSSYPCEYSTIDEQQGNMEDLSYGEAQSSSSTSPIKYKKSVSPGIFADDLKVIKITVTQPNRKPSFLYENGKGQVYLRRDGSVQGPLRPSEIQEWTRQNIKSQHLENSDFQDHLQSRLAHIEAQVEGKTFDEDLDRLKIKQLQESVKKLSEENDQLKQQASIKENNFEPVRKTSSTICIVI